MIIKSILKIFRIYEVNEEYTKPIDDRLIEIDGAFSSVAQALDSGSQMIDALNSNDLTGAVNVALEFCKIDDEVKELNEIKRKIKEEGITVETAVAAADSPVLIKEIVESTMKETTDHYKKVAELLPNIVALGKEIGEKLKNLKSEAANWSLAEKLGTPAALRNTAKKAKQVKDSAEEVKAKLEALIQSIEQLSQVGSS
jgi:uncharacterized protein YhaN